MCVVSGKKTKNNFIQTKNRQSNGGGCSGNLSIVGIGPGDSEHLSQKARDTIKTCDLLVGYKTYVSLLGNLSAKKEVFSSGMTQEIERVKYAINQVREGRRVCIISSGDPGIYGMAGLVLELLSSEDLKNIKIEIIPGISALNSCASLLGAPLMHDFAVISLSDLLTNLKLIKKRVLMAAKADFVIVFYNPQSKKRTLPLKLAWEILMRHRLDSTPVGIVTNGARNNEEKTFTTLKNMLKIKDIGMTTTIIVGNSQTYLKNGLMITPRGYDV